MCPCFLSPLPFRALSLYHLTDLFGKCTFVAENDPAFRLIGTPETYTIAVNAIEKTITLN